ATAPVAGSTNAALTPTATSPAAVRRRRMELRILMLTSPSSTYRPGMAADLPPWPQGGLDPPHGLQSKSYVRKYKSKLQDRHEHEFAQVHRVITVPGARMRTATVCGDLQAEAARAGRRGPRPRWRAPRPGRRPLPRRRVEPGPCPWPGRTWCRRRTACARA